MAHSLSHIYFVPCFNRTYREFVRKAMYSFPLGGYHFKAFICPNWRINLPLLEKQWLEFLSSTKILYRVVSYLRPIKCHLKYLTEAFLCVWNQLSGRCQIKLAFKFCHRVNLWRLYTIFQEWFQKAFSKSLLSLLK